MITRRAMLAGTAGLAAGPLLPLLKAQAQTDYPSGPIRAICMFPPGSGADVKVRFYANKLSQKTGKSVVVENRAGAMGNIATEMVARSKPDGYTIYIAPGSSMLAAAPQLFKKLNYDPIKDFEHITTLNFGSFALYVDAASPFMNVPQLTAFLQEKGEDAFYASIAPPGLVASEIYKSKFGLKTVEVKYKEQGALFNDLFSGRTTFTHIDVITAAPLLKSGRLRALAIATAQRMKSVPDIPGALEAGIPDLDIRNWWSVHVPAKTPRDICDKLEVIFNEIAMEPDTLKFLDANGSDPLPGNSKMLRELLIQDTKNWVEYAKIAKLDAI